MTGIFGYFDQNNIGEHIDNFICSIKDTGYCITDQIIKDTYILGKLDIQGSKFKRSIIIENGITIVTCGEIYNENVESLEKEIILLYKERRLNQLKYLNGSFTAAIYDREEEKLTIVNDRYGLIKLFYYYDRVHFCFSPMIKPLLINSSDRSLRKDSIIDFFLFGFLLGDKTFFEKVHQLPAASILEVSKTGIEINKYWDYTFSGEYEAKPQEELIDELGELWQKAVERRLNKYENILIPLSGGFDSRAILAAALEYTSSVDHITTFSFGEEGSYDYEIGRMVAEKADVRHIALDVEKKDFEEQYNISMADIEGMVHATPYFAIGMYRELTDYANGILSGFMGGEIMGSLISSNILKKDLRSKSDLIEAKNIILDWRKRNDLEDVQRLINFKNLNFTQSFEETVSDTAPVTNKKFIDYCSTWLYNYEEWNYTSFCIFRFRNLFRYSTPFLDNDLVDFMLKTSLESRLNKRLYKSMLLKKYPDLFVLPTKNNLGLGLNARNISIFFRKIPKFLELQSNKISTSLFKKSIFLNKNLNYMDYENLLRNNEEYRNYMRKMIEKVKEREYFNKDFIEAVWELHIKGKKNCTMLFNFLVTFELFCELYVDS